MPESTQFLTTGEAADMLGVKPAAIRKHIAAGELSALRLGVGPKARIRIDPADLARFLVPEDDVRGRVYAEQPRVERR